MARTYKVHIHNAGKSKYVCTTCLHSAEVTHPKEAPFRTLCPNCQKITYTRQINSKHNDETIH